MYIYIIAYRDVSSKTLVPGARVSAAAAAAASRGRARSPSPVARLAPAPTQEAKICSS